MSGDNASLDTIRATASAPQPRVGSAATALAEKVDIFSGRGGIEMAPLEEHGKLWVFDATSSEWSSLQPSAPKAPYPEGRSYHAMTSNGTDTIYVHAGCPEKGRLTRSQELGVQE